MSDEENTDGGPVRWEGSTGKRSVQAYAPEAEAAPEAVPEVAVEVTPPEEETPAATDAAKALAAMKGVDITTVEGTGAEGRVTKDDVQQAVTQEDTA